MPQGPATRSPGAGHLLVQEQLPWHTPEAPAVELKHPFMVKVKDKDSPISLGASLGSFEGGGGARGGGGLTLWMKTGAYNPSVV